MSRRMVRASTPTRSLSSLPDQCRRDCSTDNRRSRRAEVLSMANEYKRIADKSCPQWRLPYAVSTGSGERSMSLHNDLELTPNVVTRAVTARVTRQFSATIETVFD